METESPVQRFWALARHRMLANTMPAEWGRAMQRSVELLEPALTGDVRDDEGVLLAVAFVVYVGPDDMSVQQILRDLRETYGDDTALVEALKERHDLTFDSPFSKMVRSMTFYDSPSGMWPGGGLLPSMDDSPGGTRLTTSAWTALRLLTEGHLGKDAARQLSQERIPRQHDPARPPADER